MNSGVWGDEEGNKANLPIVIVFLPKEYSHTSTLRDVILRSGILDFQ